MVHRPTVIPAATTKEMFDAWQRHCGNLDCVKLHLGSILDLKCDAVVSPANSFGFMDGGVDALYIDHFGMHIQDRIRMSILSRHDGELLVGRAELVETDDDNIPYIIAAPTMRVPMVLPENTVNPYLATRAVLLLLRNGVFASGALMGRPMLDRIKSVSFPGMGTGVGKVATDICARQMRAAIENAFAFRHRLPASWAEASEGHQLLYTDSPKMLQ